MNMLVTSSDGRSIGPSFAGLLTQLDLDAPSHEAMRRSRLRIVIPLAIVLTLLTIWSYAAPLSGAIVAPAQIKVELNRKTIQHQEGGIVREIRVRNGQRVHAGDPLLVIGDVRSSAELGLLQEQIQAERVRRARASAEATLAPTFVAPDDHAKNAESWQRESALFTARRHMLDEQVAALELQIHEAQSQVSALQSQIEAAEVSAKLSAEELALNQKLVQDGYVSNARVLQLRRTEADYRSRIGENRSDLALARQRAADLKARIAQARNQYQQQATDEIKESATRLRELEERMRPSMDQVERQLVRAPVDGEVMGLRIAAVGDVVGPRDALLDIVPTNERLIVEAHIRPQDITHVHKDGAAEVRLTAFDARSTPLMPGKVAFVSADRVTKSDTGESWYVATIDVDAQSLKSHPEIELQAGMPAELFVMTAKRTVFQYWTHAFTAFSDRAMREP